MTRFLGSCAVLRIGALLMCAVLPLPVWACAGVSMRGAGIRVVDESAVIIWDATTHQERFIRRATFNTTSDNFGFLVPTPSVPTLTEANDAVFRTFERIVQPAVIEQKQFAFTPISLLFPPKASSKSRTGRMLSLGSVQVLDTQHVGGYDAVVLSADNADALQRWLQSHGYVAQPELLAWLTPYVQAHWNITAFKISKADPKRGYTASTAVEMTFTTSRPFFPYREPANQRAAGNYSPRSLRVFLLSADRMEGRLGDSPSPNSWPGQLFSAAPVVNIQRMAINKTLPSPLPAEQFQARLWLTTFEDHSFPRPGTDDVYFAPAAQQTAVAPPPITVTRVQPIYLPIEPLVLVAGTGLFFWRRLRRDYRRSRRQ